MQDQNLDFVDWLNINEEEELPTGTYRAQVIHAEDGESSTSGKRMLRVGFNMLEPAEYVGIGHFENYVVGSDEQPKHYVIDSRGGRAFKKLCRRANVPDSNSVSAQLVTLKGNEVMIAVRHNPESDFKNNVTNYFRVGERPAQVAQALVGTVVGPGAPAVQPPAPSPVAAPPPIAAPAPAMTSPAPPAVAASVPAPVQPPVAPAQPAAVAPPAAPAPVAPPVAPATPEAVPMTTAPVETAAPAGPMMTCTICQQQVPAMEFGAHVQAHATQG